MADKMGDKLVKAIESLADKITGGIKSDDALKFTQAALNAAHAIQTLRLTPNINKDEFKMDMVIDICTDSRCRNEFQGETYLLPRGHWKLKESHGLQHLIPR